MWEQQLDNYRKHQAALTEQASRTRAEIAATNRMIQQLSSHAAGGPAPAPIPTTAEVEDSLDDSADKEEEAMRQNLQSVLKNCASALGLDLEPAKAIDISDAELGKEEEMDKKNKRPRSLEPFASSTPKS